MVLWSVGDAAVQRVSNCHFAHLFNHTGDELIMNLPLHKKPSSGNAVFSLVEEHGLAALSGRGGVEAGRGVAQPLPLLALTHQAYCLVHVTVSKNDERGLPPKLQ